jgi:hypothetical protein
VCVQYGSGGKHIINYIQYFLQLVLFFLCAFLRTVVVSHVLSSYVYLLYLMCICCILCVFVVSYVYLLHLMCICCTLRVFVVLCVYCCFYFRCRAELVARSQYPEGPATGHLDTSFSWFPCVYKRMLTWFPSFQVATTCLSCSSPDLNFLVTFFFLVFVYM